MERIGRESDQKFEQKSDGEKNKIDKKILLESEQKKRNQILENAKQGENYSSDLNFSNRKLQNNFGIDKIVAKKIFAKF